MKFLFCFRLLMPGLLVFLIGVCGCGRQTPAQNAPGSGIVRLDVHVVKSAAFAKQMQTTWDSIVVKISAPDMDTLQTVKKYVQTSDMFSDTVANVPSGDDRKIEVWTKSKNGTLIHYGSDNMAILPDVVQSCNLWLLPLCGPITIELADIPTTVDSVFAVFYCAETLMTTAKRGTSYTMTLTIDYVPDGATGTLDVYARGPTGGPNLYASTHTLTYHADRNTTLYLDFTSTLGTLALSLNTVQPGTTVVVGSMTQKTALEQEQGPLIISEFMYLAGTDSDYVEFYNPTTDTFKTDTLVFEIVGASAVVTKYLKNVTIAPHSYYVLGDQKVPASWNVGSYANFDLITTNRWVLLRKKDRTLIDWVSYQDNAYGWPDCNNNTSVELDSLPNDPTYNNYGSNWVCSTVPIIQTPGYFGTPGM